MNHLFSIMIITKKINSSKIITTKKTKKNNFKITRKMRNKKNYGKKSLNTLIKTNHIP
jgi:hypothetical protein